MTKDVRDLIAEARELLGGTIRADHESEEARGVISRLADALEASIGERDAALTAVERVRAVHWKDARLPDWPECTHCTVGTLQDPVDWPCETIQALDGAPEPEGVWEYRARTDYVRVVAQGSLDEIGHLSGHIWERRRKAGPWLPVEGESK